MEEIPGGGVGRRQGGEDMKRRVKGHVHIKRCLGTETVFPLSAVLA